MKFQFASKTNSFFFCKLKQIISRLQNGVTVTSRNSEPHMDLGSGPSIPLPFNNFIDAQPRKKNLPENKNKYMYNSQNSTQITY